MNLKKMLSYAIKASISGGKEIMKIYDSDYQISHKLDNSPLTVADKKCHEVIEEILLETNIPLLSEEGQDISYEKRKSWLHYWLIDPLDGTKEFIKKNGEFTVNIALIKDGVPIIGVVYVPVSCELFFAMSEIGSFKSNSNYNSNFDLDNLISDSLKLPISKDRNKFVIVGSRSHMSKETELYIEEMKKLHGSVEILSRGSSLKICMIAEGKADVYPRYAPTMEWDTAAGHAIAKYAGFDVLQFKTEKEVKYNKKNLLNPWFIVK